ncbi:hypothetical protein K438DRAFT_1971927 [Mycena galopus ATCC 62051]|nr:hypothetical protein K438DRAFT_1971927 [Mycena galopus ATCC 62051]
MRGIHTFCFPSPQHWARRDNLEIQRAALRSLWRRRIEDGLLLLRRERRVERFTPSSFPEAIESSIRALLRPSDTVKVVLEALVVPCTNNTDAPDPLSPSPSLLRNRRVLAVVAHSDGPNTQEEGSGFVLKAKPTSGRAFDQTDILRVFPIFCGFSITMAQVRRETWPLPRAQSSSSPGLLSLTIKQGDIEGLDTLTLCTQHVQTLRDVLAECKRLKDTADAPPTSTAPPLATFSWLAPYTSRRAPFPAWSSLPILSLELAAAAVGQWLDAQGYETVSGVIMVSSAWGYSLSRADWGVRARRRARARARRSVDEGVKHEPARVLSVSTPRLDSQFTLDTASCLPRIRARARIARLSCGPFSFSPFSLYTSTLSLSTRPRAFT